MGDTLGQNEKTENTPKDELKDSSDRLVWQLNYYGVFTLLIALVAFGALVLGVLSGKGISNLAWLITLIVAMTSSFLLRAVSRLLTLETAGLAMLLVILHNMNDLRPKSGASSSSAD
jgi:hypothetical protein